MCPVRWNLKNQRTAQPLPVVDILRRVGISVCVIVAAGAHKAVALAGPKPATAMTALAGIRCRNFFDRHTDQVGFVGDKGLQLEARPVVTVRARICFGGLELRAALTDA
jgi:hypothetical protein